MQTRSIQRNHFVASEIKKHKQSREICFQQTKNVFFSSFAHSYVKLLLECDDGRKQQLFVGTFCTFPKWKPSKRHLPVSTRHRKNARFVKLVLENAAWQWVTWHRIYWHRQVQENLFPVASVVERCERMCAKTCKSAKYCNGKWWIPKTKESESRM